MKRKVAVSVIQMDCVKADKPANMRQTEQLVAQAAKSGAQLIVIPELFSTGYCVKRQDLELAERIPGETVGWMTEMAKQHNTYLVGAIIEKADDGTLYDTAVVVGPEGFLGKYRKMHLWASELQRFGKGDTLPVIKLPFATIGLQICYEIGFPETARILAQAGAEIIVYPSAFGKPRGYAWDIASRSRALENAVYILASNRIGTEGEAVFGGLSRIVAPNGDILAGTGTDCEAVISATLDLDEIENQRRAIPYLRDLNNKLVLKQF